MTKKEKNELWNRFRQLGNMTWYKRLRPEQKEAIRAEIVTVGAKLGMGKKEALNLAHSWPPNTDTRKPATEQEED